MHNNAAENIITIINRVLFPSLLLVFLQIAPAVAISQDIPFADYSRYPFINVFANKLEMPENPATLNTFFQKLSECQMKGTGKVKILHIGDSHVQADFFSGEVRQRFHETFTGCNGGLNLIFPYKVAKTNSSYLHTAECTGEWTSCRCVQTDTACTLGITGISVSTRDSAATLSFMMRRKLPIVYEFNRFTIMTLVDTAAFSLSVPGFDFINSDTVGLAVYHHYITKSYVDSTTVFFLKDDTTKRQITVLGMLLESGDDGIIYNSVGINGTDVRCFLRCNQLNSDVACLAPDLVIISLGTNDCYGSKWDSLEFEQNLLTFAENIRKELPGVALIFTTPPDHYRKRKHLNTDIPTACNVIRRVAKKEQAAVWDLYAIMGGPNSIRDWMEYNIAIRDKIHFNKEGYQLQGDLLFEAIIKSWSAYLDKNNVAGKSN